MGKMYSVWPLEDDMNKYLFCIYHILSWFYLLNYFIAQFFSLLTCYHAWGEITLAVSAWMEFAAFTEAALIIINYKIHYRDLQFLLINLERYLATADEKINAVLKEKATGFAVILISITTMHLVLVVLYFAWPAVTTWNNFLAITYYPPSIRSPIMDVFLLFFQAVTLIHSSCILNLDVTVVLLVYVCTVRLKILAINLQDIADTQDLKNWIQEHQYILSLAKKTNDAIKLVIAKSIFGFIIYTVGTGLLILNPQALYSHSLERFVIVLLISYLRLGLCAIAGDALVTSSEAIGSSIYFSDWNNREKDINSLKIIIMMRSKKTLKISMPGIMSTLDFAYVTTVISTSFSYFATLKAVSQ